MTEDLRGKVVAVTGAGSGIGRATAAAFAAAGARVVASDVVPAGLEETAALIRAAGHDCVAVVADVAKRADVDRLVEACLELGGIDVMVANAGVSRDRAVPRRDRGGPRRRRSRSTSRASSSAARRRRAR